MTSSMIWTHLGEVLRFAQSVDKHAETISRTCKVVDDRIMAREPHRQ